MPTTSARLIPDGDQHALLAATLERLNKACNAARVRALDEGVRGGAPLRAIVKEELERFKMPAAYNAPGAQRVEASLTRQKFGTYQSVTLPPSAVKWSGTDRVSLPTSSGRRTIRVYQDRSRGELRHPLDGRAVNLVFRNGEFELADATATDDDE
jgi:hypothetical protein